MNREANNKDAVKKRKACLLRRMVRKEHDSIAGGGPIWAVSSAWPAELPFQVQAETPYFAEFSKQNRASALDGEASYLAAEFHSAGSTAVTQGKRSQAPRKNSRPAPKREKPEPELVSDLKRAQAKEREEEISQQIAANMYLVLLYR
jgi:hypothetical protein